MKKLNKKIKKYSDIIKNCLVFILSITLIGCNVSGSTDSSDSNNRLATALTLTRDVPAPKNLIHGKEAQVSYTFDHNNIRPVLLAANGESQAKITSIVFPPGSILDSVNETCTGTTLKLGESCQYSGELSSDSRIQGNIVVNYTQGDQAAISQRFPININRLSREEIDNKLSVPSKIVFLKENSPQIPSNNDSQAVVNNLVQIQIRNDSQVPLNNVSIHLDNLDPQFVNTLDLDSITGGKYDKKDNEISMEENLPAGQTHTFTFRLKPMDQTQFLKLAKTMFDQQAIFRIGAANARIIEEPIAFSLNKNALLITISGINSIILKDIISDKSFLAENYPALNQFLINGYQYWNLYAGGVYGEDSEQPTDDMPGGTTLLTGVWANKHGVTNDNQSFNEQYREVPTIFNMLSSQFPYIDMHMITSRNFMADLAKFSNDDSSGIPDENIINLDEGKYDVDTVERLDKAAVSNLIELLKQKEPGSTSFYTIHLGLPDAATHQTDEQLDYGQTLLVTLSNINAILSAIDLKDWLVVITSDHGISDNNTHGSQDYNNKQVFALLSGSETYSKDSNLPTTLQGQTAIVPTILNYFGLTKPESLESTYIGDSNLNNNTFYLTSSFESSQKKSLQYPPQLMRNWSGISADNARRISGILNKLTDDIVNPFYYFFLNSGDYLDYHTRYNTVFSEKDSSDSFNGIGPETAKQISGAMTDGDYYVFFLNDGNTLVYHPKENKLAYGGRTTGMTSTDARNISAAIIRNKRYLGEKTYHYLFLNDGRYLKREKFDSQPLAIGQTAEEFLGMGPYSKNIIAAVSDGNYVNFFISMKNDLHGKQPLETKT